MKNSGRGDKIMIKKIRRFFFAGLLILTPIVITFYILKTMATVSDRILSPILDYILGVHLPGVGLIMLVVIIIVSGAIAENTIGKKMFAWWDKMFNRIPLIRNLYKPVKQVFSAFSNSDGKSKFSRVVMVEYPKAGSFAMGFVTNNIEGEIAEKIGHNMVSCFVPTTPNPTSGFLLIIPSDKIIPLSISVEEGIRFIISGGISVKS